MRVRSRYDRVMSAPRDDLSTLLQYKVDHTPPSNAAFVLTVVDGPDTGKTLRLDGNQPTRAFIGQSSGSSLALSDREVSRRHVGVEVIGGRLRMTDLGSKNGTVVDGIAFVEAFLKGGETIVVGQTSIRVVREDTAEASPLP